MCRRRIALVCTVVSAAGACSLRSLSQYSDGERPAADGSVVDVAPEEAFSPADAAGVDASDAGTDTAPLDAAKDALEGIPPGLVLYYRFDGNALDSSGNGRDGVLSGNARVDASGVSGAALACNVAPDRVVLGQAFQPGTSSFTIAFHARLALGDGGNNYGTFVSKGSQWNNAAFMQPGFGIGYRADQDQITGVIRDNVDGGVFSPAIWTGAGFGDGSYHHIAWVVDRSLNKHSIYGGGTFRVEKPFTPQFGSVDSPDDGWICAATNAAVTTFHGDIDELMIFARALSAAEVQALAARL